MSTSAFTVTTKRLKRRDKRRGGDVPLPQLYNDIKQGYEYFLARKMKRDTLRNGNQP